MFADRNKLINENQTGFRKGYSTTDHAFTLKLIGDFFLSKNIKLYCCFIDYAKAFDSVWKKWLGFKLYKSGITGKLFNVIQQLYTNFKRCVFSNNMNSAFFASLNGIIQGDNLSSLLLSPYVSDIESYILNNNGVIYLN